MEWFSACFPCIESLKSVIHCYLLQSDSFGSLALNASFISNAWPNTKPVTWLPMYYFLRPLLEFLFWNRLDMVFQSRSMFCAQWTWCRYDLANRDWLKRKPALCYPEIRSANTDWNRLSQLRNMRKLRLILKQVFETFQFQYEPNYTHDL